MNIEVKYNVDTTMLARQIAQELRLAMDAQLGTMREMIEVAVSNILAGRQQGAAGH